MAVHGISGKGHEIPEVRHGAAPWLSSRRAHTLENEQKGTETAETKPTELLSSQ